MVSTVSDIILSTISNTVEKYWHYQYQYLAAMLHRDASKSDERYVILISQYLKP